MSSPVYRVQCETFAQAVRLSGLSWSGVTAGIDPSNPLHTFRAFKEYRTTGAIGLRTSVARFFRRARELRGALRRIEHADRAELGRIYALLIGYDCFADDPALSTEEVRETLPDYVRECCFAESIHVSFVFKEGE